MLAPIPGLAQAWVSPAGETNVAISWQYAHFLGHVGPDGTRIPVDGSRAQTLLIDIDHSITDRFAVSLSVPYVATQFSDPRPGADRRGIEDGNYHSTLQDYHLSARYSIGNGPLHLTPHAAIVLPSHGYETEGEVAAGRGLREFQLGIDAGRTLDPFLSNAYFELDTAYVVSEKSLGISTNRTSADLSLGMFITPRFAPRLIVNYQRTYGGLACGPCDDPLLPLELREGHHRLLQDNHIRLGLAADFEVTPQLSVFAAYVTLVQGSNTHYGHSVAAGVVRTFHP